MFIRIKLEGFTTEAFDTMPLTHNEILLPAIPSLPYYVSLVKFLSDADSHPNEAKESMVVSGPDITQ